MLTAVVVAGLSWEEASHFNRHPTAFGLLDMLCVSADVTKCIIYSVRGYYRNRSYGDPWISSAG